MPLHVELVSPERVLLSTEATMVMARTIGGGDIAFLPGHAPFIGALATWVVEIIPVEGPRQLAAVHGGFISITDDSVKILSDLAELADGIDAHPGAGRARAGRGRRGPRRRRASRWPRPSAAVARANARLRAAGALV